MTILGAARTMLDGPEFGDTNRFASAGQTISLTRLGAYAPVARGLAAE